MSNSKSAKKNVGEKLLHARESQDMSLEQVSKAIHIKVKYLKILETSLFDQLPSAVQARGFLKSYAEFLNLDARKLVEEIKISAGEDSSDPETPSPTSATTTPPSVTKNHSQEIFLEIGLSIQQRREILGLSHEDIEEHTHIPIHNQKRIESGAFDQFPSPVQARGMLQNYANFLEMDQNSVMIRYAEALQTRLEKTTATSAVGSSKKTDPEILPDQTLEPKKPKMPLWLRTIVSADMLFFGVTGLLIIIFVFWGLGQVFDTQATLPSQATAPPLNQENDAPGLTINGGDAIQATATLQNQLDPSAGGGEATLQLENQGAIQLYIIADQRTYLRVIVDGQIQFDGRTVPGTNYPFSGNQQIEISTGNASALQVFYNQQDMGTLGVFGQLSSYIFLPNAIITPTPLFTQTPQPTSTQVAP